MVFKVSIAEMIVVYLVASLHVGKGDSHVSIKAWITRMPLLITHFLSLAATVTASDADGPDC